MIFIAHRGNLIGPNAKKENSPDYIDFAIQENCNVEIDIWIKKNEWYLGHDYPTYKIEENWLNKRKRYLWIHAKNIDALLKLKDTKYHYFWHETDTVTLTSKKYIWAYPGKQKIKNSIAVMPEINNDDITECIGICTDYIKKYKKNYKYM